MCRENCRRSGRLSPRARSPTTRCRPAHPARAGDRRGDRRADPGARHPGRLSGGRATPGHPLPAAPLPAATPAGTGAAGRPGAAAGADPTRNGSGSSTCATRRGSSTPVPRPGANASRHAIAHPKAMITQLCRSPDSEAQFKTLKYRPDFPTRFASIEAARRHCLNLLRLVQRRAPAHRTGVARPRRGALRARPRRPRRTGQRPRRGVRPAQPAHCVLDQRARAEGGRRSVIRCRSVPHTG